MLNHVLRSYIKACTKWINMNVRKKVRDRINQVNSISASFGYGDGVRLFLELASRFEKLRVSQVGRVRLNDRSRSISFVDLHHRDNGRKLLRLRQVDVSLTRRTDRMRLVLAFPWETHLARALSWRPLRVCMQCLLVKFGIIVTKLCNYS